MAAAMGRVGARRIIGRLAAMVISLILGPVIGTVLLFGGLFVVDPASFGPHTREMFLGSGVVMLAGAVLMGWPIALLAVLLGLAFITRERIKLHVSLAVTAVATLGWFMFSTDHSLQAVLAMPAYYAITVIALTSAAACWLLTKRLHSP